MIYRGILKDVSVAPFTMDDASGHRLSVIRRGVSFFESEYYVVRPADAARLGLPARLQPVDMIDGQVIVKLSQAWTSGATTIPTPSA